MAVFLIHGEGSESFAETLSLKLDCRQPEWGELDQKSKEAALKCADVIVCLIDKKFQENERDSCRTNEASIHLAMACTRQLEERVKLIQPVLYGITEEHYVRDFPFRLVGFPCLSVERRVDDAHEDSDISWLAEEIKKLSKDKKQPLCSPLLVHLNAYEGTSPWTKMKQSHPYGKHMELCKTPEHQSNNRSPRRHWDVWKSVVNEEIVEQANICAEYNVDVHVTGLAPLSLYLYLGMRLNRIAAQLWHVRTNPLGQHHAFEETIPDVFRINSGDPRDAMYEEQLEIIDINLLSESCDHQGPGRIAIFVTLNRDHQLSQNDLASISVALEHRQACPSHLVKAFVICPKEEGRLDMDGTNFSTLRSSVGKLFQQCTRRLDKDSWKGLALICSGPTPLAFFLGTLFHPHIHGDCWCFEYQDRKYVSALNCTAAGND